MTSFDMTDTSNILGVKIKNYGECGWCSDDENKVAISIPWEIWSQWVHISQQMGGKEWGGVFWVKDNLITGFKIPKQEVTSVECEFKEELGGDGIVHSHHNMGAFHSSQDDHHARNLYEYSIVLSNLKGYEATRRVKLPCGGFGYVKVELSISGCPEIDLNNISEKKTSLFSDLPEKQEHQQRLDFNQYDEEICEECTEHNCEQCPYLDVMGTPCEGCDTFTCKECQYASNCQEDLLPFCEYCTDYDYCYTCPKLSRYLENYPQDKDRFQHLFANKL